MDELRVSALYTYPIKSCGALEHDSFELTANGPLYDRSWMIVDPENSLVTIRTQPRMRLIQPTFSNGDMVLSAPDMQSISIPVIQNDTSPCEVTVWRDTVTACDEGDEVAVWLSDYMGEAVRLVRMPTTTVRCVDPNYAKEPAQVGFADGYPLLVVSDESLNDLNTRLQARGKQSVPMSRFRPNIVIKGGEAFIEDNFGPFVIGEIPFEGVKPCARCKVTTVDPETGEVPDVKEPLATLATFRNSDLGVIFGQNVVHRGLGKVAVGDAVIPA